MKRTALEDKIFKIIEPIAADMGLDLVQVTLNGSDGAQTLQIMAEDPETRRLSIDKCVELSRSASANLDVEDPIKGAYKLEVSSPGIDRVLTREQDFEAYEGYDVKLETQMPQENGQKRFRGILKGISNGDITIFTDQGEAIIPFDALKKAKLVLTDELIKQTAT